MSDYTIRRGDTLTAIARRHNTTVEKLAKENGIKNANLIHEGATLRIPGEAQPEAPKPQEKPKAPNQEKAKAPEPKADSKHANKVEEKANTQAPVPADPKPTAQPKDTADLSSQNPTVGEYIEQQIGEFKNRALEDAKIAGITALFGPPVVGVIYGRHMNEAKKKVAALPMDPEGKWKVEAQKIMQEADRAAREEILSLPTRTKDAVVDGLNQAGETVIDGVVAAGEAIERTGQDIVEGVQTVGQAIEQAGEQAVEGLKTAGEYALDFGKDLATNAAVVAITTNPITGPQAGFIVSKHAKQAWEEISKLPMDPDGKWKVERDAILARHMDAAKDEILRLPKQNAQAVGRGVTWAGSKLWEGLKITGRAAVAAPLLPLVGVSWAASKGAEGLSKVTEGFGSGIEWLGRKIKDGGKRDAENAQKASEKAEGWGGRLLRWVAGG